MAVGFRYQDGFLDGVLLVDGGRRAELAIRWVDGQRRVLTLDSVRRLGAEGGREGNVITCIWVRSRAQALSSQAIREDVRAQLGVNLDECEAGDVVFALDSSFGADVLAICGEVLVSEVLTGEPPRLGPST